MERLDLETILKIPCVDTDHPPAVSPDGNFLAYSSDLSGEWEIYLLSLQESAQTQKSVKAQAESSHPSGQQMGNGSIMLWM